LPARKSTSKATKKAARKTSPRKSKIVQDIASGRMKPYGPPIWDAVARGDVQEMRQLAVATRKWLKDIQTALNAMERNIKKLSKRR
jgi:hypothetical protein